MTNNEKFNALLNGCKHPRRVFNALRGLASASVAATPDKLITHEEK